MRTLVLILFSLSGLFLNGCATPNIYLTEHRQEGMRAHVDLPINTLKDVLATMKMKSYSGSVAFPILDSATFYPAGDGSDSYVIDYNPDPTPWISVKCIVDLRSEEHTSELQSRENLVC